MTRALLDRDAALAEGLAAIRAEFTVPAGFPREVLAAAEAAARRTPDAHRDLTDTPFVTLDPATATDLDQAFAIETAGGDLLLHYAIADIGWFVADGDAVDHAAWNRGETLYLPDGKAALYPRVLAEGAASLLPDGPRPAIVLTTRIAPDGSGGIERVERALIRSRAKLAYDAVVPADLPPGFAEIARRIRAAEAARGATRVDPPDQEVTRGPDGRLTLAFRPLLDSERDNAALSLATNMAVADLLHAHGTGLFRVMEPPDDRAVARLRREAAALALAWPDAMSLADFERTLRATDRAEATMMLAIRRAGGGARYAAYSTDVVPWHAAVAARYAHATAPLRRLADRYVLTAALAVANGRPVPEATTQAFARLPKVMATADARAGRIDRAVVDLAEAVMLQGREGDAFTAVATDVDDRGVRVRLCDLPILARVDATGVAPGETLTVRLTGVDTTARRITFSI
ncbi:ribonuclease [Sphingomonas sp. Leaf33]|uniref:RNB domain-containing ribonuclease n=1 Tax=Sphingomonas sp. Leaf33 TaxID=1736215 RepID=UPI0006F3650D|nr:RNB domain-containing ribonuclease [Sphingomonas sp. Leaf33]KQN25060.1 ribonuclease [Sphingomonas sp. Leaf33]